MATRKELQTLFQLQVIVLNEDDAELHPKQEQGTYLDGLADALRILTKQKTLSEILNE